MPMSCSLLPDQPHLLGRHREAEVLGRYREAEIAATRMLEAARDADWEGVTRFESTIRELARRSPAVPSEARLSPAGQRERLRTLRRLVVIDAEVRRLADPQAARLDAMLAAPLQRGAWAGRSA